MKYMINSFIHFMRQKLEGLYYKTLIKLKEELYKERLKFIFETSKGSDALLIVFSAFSGGKPRYNYYRALKKSKINKLYILDDFGYQGSYYLFEKGKNRPEVLTSGLIENIRHQFGFSQVYTAGTSKGGTAAIYFGLKHGADKIYAGACQYYISDYLHSDSARLRILEGMMGKNYEKYHDYLNSIVPQMIRNCAGNGAEIHLLYSRLEPTFEKHIDAMVGDLISLGYNVHIKEESFKDHSKVGYFFSIYMVSEIEKLNMKKDNE